MELLTFPHFMEIKHLCGIVWLVNCKDFSLSLREFCWKITIFQYIHFAFRLVVLASQRCMKDLTSKNTRN